ncbi:MAG: alpha/beta hydrolase [Parachlamydiales bacterium]|nr:alpha/beta hydrolase [Parachlamydiales bacterium]
MLLEDRQWLTILNNGQKIFAVAHFPKSTSPNQKHPCVIFCHGYGGNKIGRHRLYVLEAERLAAIGIASVRFDFRGCGDSEGDFGDITIKELISDAQIVHDFCQKHPSIDSNRIGVIGISLGGAVSILSFGNSHIKAIALWAPLASGKLWREDWNIIHPGLSSYLQVGGKTANKDFIAHFLNLNIEQEINNFNNVPLLHLHGLKDSNVTIKHRDLYRKWRQSASNSQFIELTNSDHDFFEDADLLLTTTTNWFSKTL